MRHPSKNEGFQLPRVFGKLAILLLLCQCIYLQSFSQQPARLQPAPASAPAVATPTTLPDFTFYRFNGSAFTKKDVNPKTRSFFILFDVGCEHCQREIVSIGQHYQSFKNVSFYLVTLDKQPEVEKFMSYYGKYLKGKSNVTLLADTKYLFIPTFKPLRYPGLFLYSPEQKLLIGKSGQTPIEELLKVL